MQRQHKYNTRKTYAVEDLREKLNRMRLEKGTNEEGMFYTHLFVLNSLQ